MRTFRALLLAATVAGLTIAGGASASAATPGDEAGATATASVATTAPTWVLPDDVTLERSSIPKMMVTLVWGWRP